MSDDAFTAGLPTDQSYTCPATVNAYTLAKVSGDRTLALLDGTGADTDADVAGVFLTTRISGDRAAVRVLMARGVKVPVLCTGTVAAGNIVTVSTTTPGCCKASSGTGFGYCVQGGTDAVIWVVLIAGRSVSPGPGIDTLSQAYNDGAAAADQTLTIAAAKGGPVLFKAGSVAVGALLRALTSVAGVIFEALDAAIPRVNMAGAFVQNDPAFGSPVMGNQTPNTYMSYTADGNGANWGGTGITFHGAVADIDNSALITIKDTPIVEFGLLANGNAAFEPLAAKPCDLGGGFVEADAPFHSIAVNRIFSLLDQTSGVAPTVAPNANAGTGAAAVLTRASDSAMLLTLTTGSVVGLAAGVQLAITPHEPFVTAPIVVLTPANAAAAALAAGDLYVNEATLSAGSIPLAVGVALAATTVYKWHVVIIGK